MWLRGFDRISTYPVAAGWAAILYWFDSRMVEPDDPQGRGGRNEPPNG
jgi:hypothetical protein